jgi:hypothetical protein
MISRRWRWQCWCGHDGEWQRFFPCFKKISSLFVFFLYLCCGWVNLRSLLATSFNWNQKNCNCSLLNLESRLAIPFNQNEIWGPFWRPPQYRNTRSLLAITFNQQPIIIAQSTWNPIWRFPLTKTWNPIWRFLLTQAEIWGPFWRPPLTNIKMWDPFWRSPLTKNLGIPSGDSF